MALLIVRDAQNNPQTICVQEQGTPTDRSGSIAVGGATQALMAANPLRSGWFVQNTSLVEVLLIDDLGTGVGVNSPQIGPGQTFPPPGYPVSTGVINIQGPSAGNSFVAREW